VGWAPYLLGGSLGAGCLLVFIGLRRLTDRRLDETARRRGFWPLNGGLLLAAVSMYLMTQQAAG
jgi:hypothetical protein